MNTKAFKLVVVGGVAGGASFAARARRLSEKSTIVLFEKGSAASFANCGMPYYLGPEIKNRQDLIVTSEAVLSKRYNLQVKTLSEVVQILPEKKQVQVKDLTSQKTYTEEYDKLVLSTGAAPFKPPIEGIDLPLVHSLRTLDDMDKIKPLIKPDASVAIIGGGFIGVELSEQLTKAGTKVHLVEMLDQVLPNYDKEMTVPLLKDLKKNNVNVMLSCQCSKFESTNQGKQLLVHVKDQQICVDFAIVCVGVRPDVGLAKDAGIKLGARGAIQVNEHMQTSIPDIYACGDNVEIQDAVLHMPTQIPLAGPANRQGRIAANHIFGVQPDKYRGTQGTNIVHAFDTTMASTGPCEKTLKKCNVKYLKAYSNSNDHAGYYPGSSRMMLKLLFSPEDGKILGCQAVGKNGVDKRIDVIATAIQAGMTVYDLEETELAYSPQFGSAKDPINMLGFIAAGVLRGEQHLTFLEDVLASDKFKDAVLIDVRTPNEVKNGTIPNAISIPLEELRQRVNEVPQNKTLVTYCRVGMRGYMAQRLLEQCGFNNVYNLSGGYETFERTKQ